jgi:hypothetical protein
VATLATTTGLFDVVVADVAVCVVVVVELDDDVAVDVSVADVDVVVVVGGVFEQAAATLANAA